MPAFLARTDLSRGDLRLFLRNDLGYAQDGWDVRWTIFRASGAAASGRRLQAVKATTGEYYAPWSSSDVNGSYRIVWEYRADPGTPLLTKEEKFFVIAPSSYQCGTGDGTCPGAVPPEGSNVFTTGQNLAAGDLPLFIRNEDGVPTNAYAVFWTVQNCSGYAITRRFQASQGASLGEYFAPWLVNVLGGDYVIKWEYMLDSTSPLEAVCMRFSVISPAAIFFVIRGMCLASGVPMCAPPSQPSSSCCPVYFVRNPSYSPCAPVSPSGAFQTVAPMVQQSCCSLEIARVVHLTTQTLPISGSFTDQPAYQIPNQVRKVSLYVTYRRGAVGGFAVLRLLWGNGTDETQSTLINADFLQVNGQSSAQELFLNDLRSPVPQGSDPINFLIETTVPGGSRTVRLLAAEGGVPGAPGVITVTLTASSE